MVPVLHSAGNSTMRDLIPVLGVFQYDLAAVICKQSVDRDCLRHVLNRVNRVSGILAQYRRQLEVLYERRVRVYPEKAAVPAV